jgi:hypothetical protein
MRTIFFATILSLLALNISGQDNNKKAYQAEIEAYIEENIAPQLIIQQEQLTMALSKADRKSLEEIREQIQAFHAERENRRKGNQEGKKGDIRNKSDNGYSGYKGNRGDMDDQQGRREYERQQIRTRAKEMHDEVDKIIEKYPDAVGLYKEYIENNKERWQKGLGAISDKYNLDYLRSSERGQEKHDRMFERLSDPAWLLIWDPEQKIFRRMMSAKSGQDRGRTMDMDEDLRAAVRAYVGEQIIPVVAEERKAFDQYLSDQEKEEIMNARAAMENARRNREKTGENNGSGRGQMKGLMEGIHEIARNYQQEMDAALSSIRANESAWRRDLIQLAAEFGLEPGNGREERFFQRVSRRFTSPAGFLLFDPDRPIPDNENSKPSFSLSLFPNPANRSTSVRLNGLADSQLSVILYSREGEKIMKIFDGQLQNESSTFTIDTSELEEGIYFVSVYSGDDNQVIKLIVKH